MPALPVTLFSHCDSSMVGGTSGAPRLPLKGGGGGDGQVFYAASAGNARARADDRDDCNVGRDGDIKDNDEYDDNGRRRVNNHSTLSRQKSGGRREELLQKTDRGDDGGFYGDRLKSSSSSSTASSGQRDLRRRDETDDRLHLAASSSTAAHVHLPGVGRAFASPSGHVRVDFEDGSRLDVEGRGEGAGGRGLVGNDVDNTMEYVDVAGRTRRFRPDDDFLPGEVKEKLKRLPSVLDQLAELKLR